MIIGATRKILYTGVIISTALPVQLLRERKQSQQLTGVFSIGQIKIVNQHGSRHHRFQTMHGLCYTELIGDGHNSMLHTIQTTFSTFLWACHKSRMCKSLREML